MTKRNTGAGALLCFLKKKGRLWLLLGGALAGIALLLLGNAYSTQESAQTPPTLSESAETLAGYEQVLEKEIKALCTEVKGVGQVDVMVHLESGTRVVYTTDAGGDPATVGNGKEPLYATLLSPRVAGVAIVCRGGADPAIQKQLTDLVSTALNISAARVCVAGK